jgi:hypothetical protein
MRSGADGALARRAAERRRAGRRHQYALPDFGLTEDQVEGAFGGYAEFTRVNKIRVR